MSEGSKPRPKRRRWRLLILAALALPFALWIGLDVWLDHSDFRPMAIARLSEATGLPVSIDDLEVALLPAPGIRASGVRIGDGELRAELAAIQVAIRLRSLLAGEVDITSLLITGLELTVPADADTLDAELRPVREHLANALQPSGNGDGAAVRIGTITIENAALRQEGKEQPLAVLSASIQDPTEPDLSVAIAGQSAYLSDAFSFNGHFGVAADKSITFDAAFQDADPATLLAVETMPIGPMDGRVEGTGPTLDSLTFSLTASAKPGGDALNMGGTLEARGQWRDNTLAFNDVAFEGDGLRALADVTRHPAGEWAFHIVEAHASGTAASTIAAKLLPADWQLTAIPEARIDAQNILAALPKDSPPRVASGSLTASGFHLDGPQGRRALAGIAVNLAAEENVLRIDRFEAEGITLAGAVQLDPANRSAALALSGDVVLDDSRIQPWLNEPDLQDMAGTLHVTEARCTLTPDTNGLPSDLFVAATLSNGAIHIAIDNDFVETFSRIEADIEADAHTMKTSLTAVGDEMGPVKATGSLPYDSLVMTGTASGRAATLAKELYWNDWAESSLTPVFAAFGEPIIQWKLTLPQPERERIDLHLETANGDLSASLTCDVAWPKKDTGKGYGFDGLHLSAIVPGHALYPFAPQLSVSGPTGVSLVRAEGTTTFALNVTLDNNAIAMEPWLQKPSGIKASVHLSGITNGPGWRAQELAIAAVNQEVRGQFASGAGVAFPDIRIDLAQLAPITPPNATVRGTLRGAFNTEPKSGTLQLADAALSFANGPSIEYAQGELALDPDGIAFHALQVRGANSDFVLDGRHNGSAWSGSITGKQLDVFAVRQAVEEVQRTFAAGGEGDGDGPTAERKSTPIAVDVALDSLLYKNGPEHRPATFTHVKGRVESGDSGLSISIDNAVPYQGTLTGNVTLTPAGQTAPRRLSVNVIAAGIDARILDDFFFPQPRGLTGALTGSANFAVPLTDDQHPMAGFSGSLSLDGAKGSLGKVGMATQLLAVLSAMQVWQLHRMPGKEEGLTYDKASLRLSGEQGVMNVETLSLDNPYIRVRGKGRLDFPGDTCDVPMDVQVLQGVTRTLEPIPVVGEAANAVTERIGVIRVAATGPPLEPELKILSVTGFKGLGGVMRDVGGAAVDTLDKQVVDRIVGTLDSLLRGRR